jgi:hypothetical protein
MDVNRKQYSDTGIYKVSRKPFFGKSASRLRICFNPTLIQMYPDCPITICQLAVRHHDNGYTLLQIDVSQEIQNFDDKHRVKISCRFIGKYD